MISLAIAAAAITTSGAASLQRDAVAEIIDVERDFAQDSVRSGTKQSFLRYIAPDGVIFRPQPVPGLETIRKDPDDNPSEGFLDWWPAMAGVSRSGDLGFSVGPWHQHLTTAVANYPTDTYGYYCTIWRRQLDGRWKFVIDGAGAFLRTIPPTRPRGSAVTRIPVSDDQRVVATGALSEVRAIEVELSKQARVTARETLPRYYLSDAWVMGSPVEVQPGPRGWEPELSRRPAALTFNYIGGGESSAGDVAYTYGSVESAEAGVTLRDATYLHIWMRKAGEWRIVFDGIKQRRSFQ